MRPASPAPTAFTQSACATTLSLPKLLLSWSTPFVRLSCELEGHALGGGMLKLEPREAGRIMFHPKAKIVKTRDDELEDAITLLQRWRHYAE